jgi:hypothetical protein
LIFKILDLRFSKASPSPHEIEFPEFRNNGIKPLRDNDASRVLEGDESSIEEVIDVRRQHQPIVAVKTLNIVGLAPRFHVARNQVARLTDPSDSTAGFMAPDFGSEQSLAKSRSY